MRRGTSLGRGTGERREGAIGGEGIGVGVTEEEEIRRLRKGER